MKINPFPLSPTLSSTKVSVIIVCVYVCVLVTELPVHVCAYALGLFCTSFVSYNHTIGFIDSIAASALYSSPFIQLGPLSCSSLGFIMCRLSAQPEM